MLLMPDAKITHELVDELVEAAVDGGLLDLSLGDDFDDAVGDVLRSPTPQNIAKAKAIGYQEADRYSRLN